MNPEDKKERRDLLVKKRGLIKSNQTRLLNAINNHDNSKLSLMKLIEKKKLLQETIATMNDITTELMHLDPSGKHDEENENIMDTYVDISTSIEILKQEMTPPEQVPNTNEGECSNRATPSEHSQCHATIVEQSRIPKIGLKTFDGSIEKWKAFHDWFIATIDQRERLSDGGKLSYLQECLQGEAARTIQGFEPTDQNYKEAWELLLATYNNTAIIIHRHYELLTSIPKMTNNTSENIRDLVNEVQVHVRGMKVLGEPVEHWNTPLVYLVQSKLDNTTRKEWKRTLKGNEVPKYTDLIEFLRAEASRIQSSIWAKDAPSSNTNRKNFSKTNFQKPSKLTFTTQTCRKCHLCTDEDHSVFKCQKLLKANIQDRIAMVKRANICFNCLRKGHRVNECTASNCQRCGKAHNTLLHLEECNKFVDEAGPSEMSRKELKRPTVLTLNGRTEELMVTAIVNVLDYNKRHVRCRALIDTGATSNFITTRLADTLNLQRRRYEVPVQGLGEIVTSTSHMLTATIQSRFNNFEKTLNFLTVDRIAEQHPINQINRDCISIPSNVKLADPTFHIPAEVDMIIGAGPALSLLCVGQINLSAQGGADLVLQKTQLGWIIGGSVAVPISRQKRIQCNMSVTQALQQLSKFWNLEESQKTKHLSPTEEQCEKMYQNFTTRGPDGRYTVALPFNEKKSDLGESAKSALKRFLSLERKWKGAPDLKEQYENIIQEYLDLGHMEVASQDDIKTGVYLPHHAVLKESSATTKVRVVFDGSAKTSTGISLNETLLIGPTLQPDVFAHWISFREKQFVITGDIEKMYRQVRVRPEDRKYLLIFWRDKDGNIITLKMTVLTFGTASAPYLATRTLEQLAIDEGSNYPKAAQIIRNNMYVDDLIAGASSINEAKNIRDQMIAILKTAGFNMRQWASNDSRILSGLPVESINTKLQLETDQTLKTLGVQWQSANDIIVYTVQPSKTKHVATTKRTILSEIAKIFDPLGLLGPIIVMARLIMQSLWRQELDWDESLPGFIQSQWINFAMQLNNFNYMAFRRWVTVPEAKELQLHGFCDASEKAYGAVIYVRTVTKTGNIQVSLLCSKARVAPLKTTTLARLELCAALELARLYEAIKDRLTIKLQKTIFWSDSTIALNWISTLPCQLKTFVANRVAEIQEKTQEVEWRHVNSEENPADALSRGQLPNEFKNNELWVQGPRWLADQIKTWPQSKLTAITDQTEMRKIYCFKVAVPDNIFLRPCSSYRRRVRVIAYCLRFRPKQQRRCPLKLEELLQAEIKLLHIIQAQAFPQEIQRLKTDKEVDNTSCIKGLNPFIDKHGVLRVGGRLSNANIPYDQQHPIIMPNHNQMTRSLIEDEHKQYYHTGAKATLANLRRKYWPINGASQVNRVIRQCVSCRRFNPPLINYKMGDLPRERVNQVRPFFHTGVDYCGPFLIKEKRHRNTKSIKVYVAVFVCLAVKAVHLEVVSQLTTEAFIAALKRFIARRGKCQSLHSDNGTNFVSANKQFRDIFALLQSESHNNKVEEFLTDQGIVWKFNSPRAPHEGGLWEAAVKSFKRHFLRIVGNTLLPFEEFNTLTIEIEAILNSRPLIPISTDPNDPIALTPGHFLIGDALTALPELDFLGVPVNRLSSWQMIQRLRRHFWNRWKNEYLHQLNIRQKWKSGQHSITVGSIVLIKDENQRPLQWALGRVIEVHPGKDGTIRRVSIRASKSVIERNVRYLVPLLEDPQILKSMDSH